MFTPPCGHDCVIGFLEKALQVPPDRGLGIGLGLEMGQEEDSGAVSC